MKRFSTSRKSGVLAFSSHSKATISRLTISAPFCCMRCRASSCRAAGANPPPHRRQNLTPGGQQVEHRLLHADMGLGAGDDPLPALGVGRPEQSSSLTAEKCSSTMASGRNLSRSRASVTPIRCGQCSVASTGMPMVWATSISQPVWPSGFAAIDGGEQGALDVDDESSEVDGLMRMAGFPEGSFIILKTRCERIRAKTRRLPASKISTREAWWSNYGAAIRSNQGDGDAALSIEAASAEAGREEAEAVRGRHDDGGAPGALRPGR